MKFLLKHRFNYFDVFLLTAAVILFVRERYVLSAIVAFLGALCVVLAELANIKAEERRRLQREEDERNRQREWQSLADAGHKLEAIGRHRMLYGSSLKEALEAVEDYMGLPRR